MKKWIRWQGLIVFVALIAVVVLLWIFFIDGIVRRAIEKTGTFIVGAEVDVKNAHVKLVPLSITLRGLEITNPEAPATNSLECERIAFSLDSLNLLRRKVIINEMSVEGVRFDTQRKKPGSVKKTREKQPEAEKKPSFALSISIPDAKTILQTARLESPTLIASAQADLQKRKEQWQQRINEMPDRVKLDAYKSRVDTLRQSKQSGIQGLVGQLDEARALANDISRDLERVEKAKSAFLTDLASARNLVERAERAPMDDVQRLRETYGISASGLQNMSQMLFGDAVGSWVRTGLLWYDRLKPVVERAAQQKREGEVKVVKPLRGRGVDVRFKEARPLPDFLISTAAASAEMKAGAVAGTIRNITPDQDVLGRPLTFLFVGEKLNDAQSIELSGTLNHIVPSIPDDTARVSLRGYRAKEIALSNHKDLPITLREGLLDLDLQGSRDAKTLKAKFIATINSAQLSAGGPGSSNQLVAAIQSTLSKVTHFSLTADITGTPENYDVHLSSDLDRVLKDAVGRMVQEQGARLEQELKAAIQEKTGRQLKDLKEGFVSLSAQGSRLDDVQNRLNALLKDATQSGGGGKFRLR